MLRQPLSSKLRPEGLCVLCLSQPSTNPNSIIMEKQRPTGSSPDADCVILASLEERASHIGHGARVPLLWRLIFAQCVRGARTLVYGAELGTMKRLSSMTTVWTSPSPSSRRPSKTSRSTSPPCKYDACAAATLGHRGIAVE